MAENPATSRPRGSLLNAVPGIAAVLVNILAPVAAFTSLMLSSDPRVRDALARPEVVGVMDVHLQLTTVFVTSLVLLITSLIHLGSRLGKTESLSSFGYLCIVTAGLTLLLFVWMFTMAGAAQVSLDYYIRVHEPGSFTFPPPKSFLTWIRGVLFVVSGIFTIFQYRGAGVISV